jgi:hypothetical protein
MSALSAIRPDPRPILLKDPIALEIPLKLLLPPPSLKLRDLFFSLLTLSLGELGFSESSDIMLQFNFGFATTNFEMVLRQKGQVGDMRQSVDGLGLLWQQRESVHGAHIWCAQSRTSIAHSRSKQMLQSSDSLP